MDLRETNRLSCMASMSGVQGQFLAVPGWYFLIECLLISGCGCICTLSLSELKLEPLEAKNDFESVTEEN